MTIGTLATERLPPCSIGLNEISNFFDMSGNVFAAVAGSHTDITISPSVYSVSDRFKVGLGLGKAY